jgi:uncharacterized lipoprotein YmbA
VKLFFLIKMSSFNAREATNAGLQGRRTQIEENGQNLKKTFHKTKTEEGTDSDDSIGVTMPGSPDAKGIELNK